jgi:hypothetical protein
MAATIIPLLALAVIIFVLWTAIRATIASGKPPPHSDNTTRSLEERHRVALSLRDRLSRKPLGTLLAERIWRKLLDEVPGTGVIYDHHRDFCGQGLIRTENGVMLADVQDGGLYFGPPIAEWSTETDFVAFLARQSDFFDERLGGGGARLLQRGRLVPQQSTPYPRRAGTLPLPPLT